MYGPMMTKDLVPARQKEALREAAEFRLATGRRHHAGSRIRLSRAALGDPVFRAISAARSLARDVGRTRFLKPRHV
jgi:hypothetical protein